MHTILNRLREFFPFVNTRPATENDFFDYCLANDVDVVFASEVRKGMYARFAEHDFIFLNSQLYGWPLRYVMFHEIGHQLLHVPGCGRDGSHRFDDVTRSRHHAEAEAVAAYLLLPATTLEAAMRDDEFRNNERLGKLMLARIALGDLE